MKMVHAMLTWTAVGLAPGCLQARPSMPSPTYVTIGEAWSGDRRGSPIAVAYRLFTASQLAGMCPGSIAPARLVAEPATALLRVGEWFALDSLAVVAVDASARRLPPVPLRVDVETPEPPMLDLRSDRIAAARVRPIRTGQFMFRLRTLCPGAGAEVFVPASVSR